MSQKQKWSVLERNKNMSHVFVGNSQNNRSLGAVDDLMYYCPRPSGMK